MSWATRAIEELGAGKEAVIYPKGNSMQGKVESGDRVTLQPANPEALKVGDVVLVRVNGRDYLHLIKAKDGPRFQIGNNKGHINGWVGPKAIHGLAVRIERS